MQTKAAILGHDGNQWAASAGFAVSAAEGKAIANSFNDPSSAFSTGIHLLGCKYMTIKADQRSIYGKLKVHIVSSSMRMLVDAAR